MRAARSRLPGASVIEYIVMFPQSVPRLIFAFGMMWAWLIFPIPIYGTLWLLALAYFTVLLPLGVRTLAGVVVQIDKSLEDMVWRIASRFASLGDRQPAVSRGALYALFDGLFQRCLLRHLSGDRRAIADLQEEVGRLLPTVA